VHHANKENTVLVQWLPSTPSTIPQPSSHYVRVGVAVVDERNRILVVQEKFGPASRRGKDFWKMPTGLVDNGEDIAAAAVREVMEETGVKVRFEGVLAFRQNHKTGVEGKTDLFFLCKATPLSSEIIPQESEIARAEWMPLEEYFRWPGPLTASMMAHSSSGDASSARKLISCYNVTHKKPHARRTSKIRRSPCMRAHKRNLNPLTSYACALVDCSHVCAFAHAHARHVQHVILRHAHAHTRSLADTQTHARTHVHTPVCSKPLWPDFSAYWWMSRLAAEAFLGGKGDLPGFRLPAAPGVCFYARACEALCKNVFALRVCQNKGCCLNVQFEFRICLCPGSKGALCGSDIHRDIYACTHTSIDPVVTVGLVF